MQSNAFVRGLMGPIGSGKSITCVQEIMRRAKEQKPNAQGVRKSRWAIIRNTYPELKTTTIKSWHEWYPSTVGHWKNEGPPTHFFRDSEFEVEVIFLALDNPSDVKKLLSLELTGAWINEARELPKVVLENLMGRVGRYPAKKDGGATWYGIIMDTNPPDDSHWWYKFAEEDAWFNSALVDIIAEKEGKTIKSASEVPEEYAFEFFRQPDGLSAEAENTHNLPAGYYAKQMAGHDEDWINVYVRANYGFVKDGKPIYTNYKDAVHYSKTVEYNEKLPLYVGIDFGLTPAAVIAQRGVMGNWYLLDELVTEDMGAKRFGTMLMNKLQAEYPNKQVVITGDPAGEQRAQTDETTPFQMLKSIGLYAKPARTNDFAVRVEVVQSALGRLLDGKAGLIVGPKCVMLRKALGGGYCYKRMNVGGGEKYQDKPDKNHYSHIAEALQYALLGGGEGQAVMKSFNPNARRRPYNGVDYNELDY